MIDSILVILSVVLFIKLSRVNKKIAGLESEIIAFKTQQQIPTNQQVSPQFSIQHPNTTPIQTPVTHIVNTVTTLEPQKDNDFLVWFKENPLLKIGILMILVGFGWFVNYAFTHDWIGPVGRITLGIMAGTIVTIFGTFRLGKNETQGNALTILGSALIIITVLAGEYFFSFFNAYIVLGIIFIVSLYTSLSAFAYSSKRLAVYGMLISLAAPVFSHTTEIEPFLLYFYLLIVSIAGIWISMAKNWRFVNSVGITGIFLYSLPSLLKGAEVLLGGGNRMLDFPVLFVVYIISILYLTVSLLSIIKNNVKLEKDDAYLTIANTLIILGFTIGTIPEMYTSLVIAGWMLVYAISGFIVFLKTKNQESFYIHSLISILFLAIATSIELQGQTLVIAFAIEAMIVVITSFIVTNKIEIAKNFALLFGIPFFMSLQSISSPKWENPIIFHSDFAVLLVMAIIMGIIGLFYRFNDSNKESRLGIHHIMFIGSTFFIYTIIWLSTHSIIGDNDTAVFVSLFIYTIVGLATHFYGLFKQNSVLKKYGMTLLILVVVRLVFVDVWNMDLVLRVITFIVLGIMFMSSAFISKNQKNSIATINQ